MIRAMSEPEMLTYADRVIRDALLVASNGMDCDVAVGAIDDMLHAWAAIAKRLREVPVGPRTYQAKCRGCGGRVDIEVAPRPEELARAASHVGKGIDEIARLVAFAKGQPDSRPDGGRDGRDVLRLLTDEQVRHVERWLEENQTRAGA